MMHSVTACKTRFLLNLDNDYTKKNANHNKTNSSTFNPILFSVEQLGYILLWQVRVVPSTGKFHLSFICETEEY